MGLLPVTSVTFIYFINKPTYKFRFYPAKYQNQLIAQYCSNVSKKMRFMTLIFKFSTIYFK